MIFKIPTPVVLKGDNSASITKRRDAHHWHTTMQLQTTGGETQQIEL